MYESRNAPLLHPRHFRRRLLLHCLYAILLILATLLLGVFGLWLLNDFTWHDAFMNAVFIVGGIGTYMMPTTTLGRLFFAAYGFFVALVVMATLGVILAPLAHRIMHKFHLDDVDTGEDAS
ncbi:two pore domain potassium channel family protein [Castellaniella sp.]|uniref:two pore domain potassium channel family protein n=1 Tax=Castellaniella sp. TaxID=1955812 RepID=UPI0035657A77